MRTKPCARPCRRLASTGHPGIGKERETMKLLTYLDGGQPRLGCVVKGDKVLDITSAWSHCQHSLSDQPAPADVLAAIKLGDDLEPAVNRIIESAGEESVLRSEEHTSELQSRENLVCRLLL